ncbi:Protein of unknown function [Pyronema omphalodes CBS 100304]|uniref:Uncharacterized protein n=1 Tax=Pyronema omphalodes (strain CBS 100304) TaxID=1076935 RepID=U4LQ75_PYROM|nr:Protein of unknown function [Pyronema omphalodes CBS 100304]
MLCVKGSGIPCSTSNRRRCSFM